MTHTVVNPVCDTPHLRRFLAELPGSFQNGGDVIYCGRNTVKRFSIGDREYIVKRFRKLSLVRSMLYIARSSKACRAYGYGLEFRRRGVMTPEPVAAVDICRGFLLYDSYFISMPMYARDMTFLRCAGHDIGEADMLARFLFSIQQQGILHGDLNLTNILLADADASDPLCRYALIDTNRSRILPAGVLPSMSQRAANLMRLTHRRDLLRSVLNHIPMPVRQRNRLILRTFRALLRQEARKRILHRIFPH